jgi:hypothetical protein
MTAARAFPIPEDYGIGKPRPAVYLYRAGAAYLRAAIVKGNSAQACARKMFDDGGDRITDIIIKAASAPATIGNAGWAGNIAGQAIDDSIAAIASLSAGAALIQRGLKVDLTGLAQLHVPGRTINAAQAGAWIGEGGAIPARALNFTAGVTLAPKKLAVIVTMTREVVESSAIEPTTRALLSEASALALDAAVFSATAAGNQPAGILNGVAALTATIGGGEKRAPRRSRQTDRGPGRQCRWA